MSDDQVLVVNGQFPLMLHCLECQKCHKKILVEIALAGTNHNVGVSATCGSCMLVNEDFAKKNPEQTKLLQEWVGPERQQLKSMKLISIENIPEEFQKDLWEELPKNGGNVVSVKKDTPFGDWLETQGLVFTRGTWEHLAIFR